MSGGDELFVLAEAGCKAEVVEYAVDGMLCRVCLRQVVLDSWYRRELVKCGVPHDDVYVGGCRCQRR